MAEKVTPRARRKEDAKAKILAAARRIVLDQGFAALTMRAIAEVAGYSPAALYLHFESREAIACELGSAGMRALHDRLAQATMVEAPLARIEALARAYAAFAAEEPETYRLIFMEPGFAATALGGKDAAGQAAYDLLVRAFADLAATGRLRAGRAPAGAALTFWVLLHGIVSLKMTCSAFLATPVDEVLSGALGDLLQGLLEPPRREAPPPGAES